MSKLNDLIKKLCPNGVEFKTLGEVAEIVRGKGLQKSDIVDGDTSIILYGELYTTYGNYITKVKSHTINEKVVNSTLILQNDILLPLSSTTKDACIGKTSVYTLQEKCFLGGDALILRHKQNSAFLMYFLNSDHFKQEKMRCVKGTTIQHLSVEKLKSLSIPLPPLSVQAEIVRILDTFTCLTTELTTELTARKKQYAYYRDNLLKSQGVKGVEWKTLGEVATKITSGGTPNTSKREYYNGDIPWLRTQEVKFSDIYDTEIKITEEGLQKSSAKYIPMNCVIIAMYGATVGNVAINKIPLTTNQACCNIECNDKIINYRYLFYVLCNMYDYIKSLGQGSQNNINAGTIKSLQIPLPPLSVQAKIVAILDRFDSLCNDICKGLPAEIEARRKQYEYYRNALLTFA